MIDIDRQPATARQWRYHPRQSFTIQYLWSEGMVDSFYPFQRTINEVTLGWKLELSERGVLELGFIENLEEHDNGPDFGIHAGFSQRF